jgi:hypothetical protein
VQVIVAALASEQPREDADSVQANVEYVPLPPLAAVENVTL